jgi:hypothetical protein
MTLLIRPSVSAGVSWSCRFLGSRCRKKCGARKLCCASEVGCPSVFVCLSCIGVVCWEVAWLCAELESHARLCLSVCVYIMVQRVIHRTHCCICWPLVFPAWLCSNVPLHCWDTSGGCGNTSDCFTVNLFVIDAAANDLRIHVRFGDVRCAIHTRQKQKHEKKLYAQFLHWESIEVQVPISARKTIFNFNAAINRKFETWNGFTFRHHSHRLEINSLQLNKSNPSCRTWRSCFNITFAAQLKYIKQTQAQGRRGKNQLRTCVMRYAAKLPRGWCIQRILVSRRIHPGRQNGLKNKWNTKECGAFQAGGRANV